MKQFKLLAAMFIMCLTIQTQAQIKTPAASPSAKVMQTIGLTDVMVEYSRPGVKGRTIFAEDGLVPFGKVWRTGANSATKIDFSTDVMIEGNKVSKGAYAVLTMPGKAQWAVHFYAYEGGRWSSYIEKTPDLVVNVAPSNMANKVENFLITFDDLTDQGAKMEMLWDNTAIALNIGVNSDEAVMAAIEKTLGGPTAGDYYTAGNYYHNSGKDLAQALEWVQKATKVENPKFWQVRREALILADMGKTKEAIAAAKKSLDLAKAAGNDDYVRLNEKSLAEWMK